jgi:6-phosphogluconolactonase (cycloisomerase 2 family)/uncharacterized protein YjdB
MILQRARRLRCAFCFGFNKLTALTVLGAAAMLSGCGWSSFSIQSLLPQAPELASIAVGPPDSSVAMGLTHQFTATGVYSDGSKLDISSQVNWRSAQTAIASVNTDGVATAISPGTTMVTATMGRLSGSTNLAVTAATLMSIGVTPTNMSLASGTTDSLRAIGVYSDNLTLDLTTSVTWSSSAPTVASVRNSAGAKGITIAVSPGSSMITATLGAMSGSTMLTVTAASLVSIGVTPTNPSIANGLTDALKATGVYTDNSMHDLTSMVTWSSSAPTIVTVSNTAGTTGVTTAVSPGSSTITATLDAVSGSTTLTVTAATLVSIGVTPAIASIAMGLKTQFTAMGTYTDNSTQNITAKVVWTSSAPSIATVSNASGYDGLTIALSPGPATITATLGTIAGSTGLTVTPATLVSIGLTPTSPSIATGLTAQFVATGVYTDNSTQNLTTSVAWTSSDPTVVAVSNASGSNGLATALGQGSVTITASSGGVSGSTGLTVTPATLVSIGVTPISTSIAAGLTTQFIATGVYTDNSTQNLTTSVAWTSSDPTVVAVSNAMGSNGLATALGQGSVTITASSGGVSGSTGLTITPATLVSIAVTPANPSIANGTTQQFVATGTYTDNSTQNLTTAITWASSNPSLAAISNASGSNGLATALGQGSVTITATVGTVSGWTSLTVTPATLVSIAVLPSNPGIASGTSQQFAAIGTYTDNSTHDVTTSVAWGSSDINVATISNASGCNGLATALGQGSVTITAALGSVSGSTGLSVTPATLVSIAVIPANSAIANGTNQQFAAIGTYTDNSTQPLTTSVNWNSSNSAVAIISNASGSNGLTSAVAQGSVTITAILGGVSGSTGLTVTPATLVSIAVTPATTSVADGTSQQFTATGTYTDGSTQNLTAAATWNSSDTTIASISNAAGSSGLATGLGVGSTSISAAVGTVASPTVTLTVTADPEYVYATNQNDNTVSEYVIGAGGTLTSIGTVAAGSEPNAVAIDPTGGFVYVANWNGASLSQYAIGTGGVLTALGTIASGNEPASVTVGPTGQYVYAANLADNTVSQYTIGMGGVLTSLGTVAAGSSPISVTIDPTGHYAYVANENSSNVSEYAIGAGGALTSVGLAPTGNSPQSVTVDPSDRYAYVANWSGNTVSEYTIGAGGILTAIGTISTGNCPETVAVDPSSRYVYVENWCDGSVSEYTIGAGGALNAIGTIATGSGPWFITIDPSGRYVYVANFNSSTVSQYTIGTGGALTAVGTVATGNGPNAITAGY